MAVPVMFLTGMLGRGGGGSPSPGGWNGDDWLVAIVVAVFFLAVIFTGIAIAVGLS